MQLNIVSNVVKTQKKVNKTMFLFGLFKMPKYRH